MACNDTFIPGKKGKKKTPPTQGDGMVHKGNQEEGKEEKGRGKEAGPPGRV